MDEMMWWQLGFMAVVLVFIVAMYLRQARLVRELQRDRDDARAAGGPPAGYVAGGVLGGNSDLKRMVEADPGDPRMPAGHSLTVLNKPEPACQNCEHFDLEEGQAQLRQHRAFAQVTEIVSPAMMSQEAKLDDAGNLLVDDDGVVEKTEPAVPHKTKWSEFGACMKHQEARWQRDKCDDHSPQAAAANTMAAG